MAQKSRQDPPLNQSARKRFRGRLFISWHQDAPGDDKPIQSMHVCVDFLSACLMIRDSPGGDMLLAMPSEGREFRDFLAGGDPPFHIPTARHPENLVGRVAGASDSSKTLARTAIDAVLRESTGAGAEIYRDRALLPVSWGGQLAQKMCGLTTMSENKVDHNCAD